MTYTKVQKLIYKMMTTSTGAAMCDSGDAYGRNWEKNQKKSIDDFNNEPAVSFEINTYGKDEDKYTEYDYTINIFHYLSQLQLDDTCNCFNRLKCKDWYGDLAGNTVYGISESQGKWLENHGFEFDYTVNTYNGECFLSQTLQYSIIHRDRDYYVLLQIHQGCDVRGGYTDAVMFALDDCSMPCENVYGEIDGKRVSNTYDGVKLRYDLEDYNDEMYEKEVDITENSKGSLDLCS